MGNTYLLRPSVEVRLSVEVPEEEEEHDGVHSDPPDENSGVVTVDEEELERVDHDEDELHLKQTENYKEL